MIPGHKLKEEQRQETLVGYGDHEYQSGYRVLVCSCGNFEARLNGDYKTSYLDKRILILEHLLEELAKMMLKGDGS